MASVSETSILVTGATGYVGGRLIPRLLDRGYRVRAMARSLEKLRCRSWAQHPHLEAVAGDVLDRASLIEAVAGCSLAYYLVHSMSSAGKDYAEADRTAANNMVAAVDSAGLERIIYLGGLGDEAQGLSHHLQSRNEVGRILASGKAQVTFLRAAMILGAGSASFEILRYLADRLPIMITPRWVRTRVQPIAISNVLNYLIGCLECPETSGRILDIGGPEVMDYERLFRIYAEEAGLPKRLIIPVPFFTPSLSSYWIHLVTPVPASLARPLAAGLKNTVVADDAPIRSMIPQKLLTCRETIQLALDRIRHQTVETCWMDSGRLLPPEWPGCDDAVYAGGTSYDTTYIARFKSDPQDIWQTVSQMGLPDHDYFQQRLWRLRGFIDRLIGGVGIARFRRPDPIMQVGDAIDFWRVLKIVPGIRLVLQAEMKMPGQAFLEFRVETVGKGESELAMFSRFIPTGMAGIIYWHVLRPMHNQAMDASFRSITAAVKRPLLDGPRRGTGAEKKACPVDLK